jgi:pyrroline-5-carboxylate reductase
LKDKSMTINIGGSLLLVGAGKMGSAMASGWLEQGLAPDSLFIQDPAPCPDAEKLIATYDLVNGDDLTLPTAPVIIVLAVKPQMMAGLLPDLRKKAGEHTLFLSIAAGQSLSTLASHLGDRQPIVRSMPNTPAAIGRGMTVACSNDFVTPDQAEHCITLLASIGEIAWIEDEAQMDAVTAVSGSGPAYLFALTECLALAAINQGLDKKLAWQLATTTMEGAAALMRHSCDNPVILRKNVTSPGGTTEAALNVLMGKKGLPKLMDKAITAATKRSKELSG